MKLKLINLIFVTLFSNLIFGQSYPKYEEYKHFSVKEKNDTINYHIYSAENTKEAEGIILYIQGSGAEPFFKIKRTNDHETIRSQIPFNLDKIPENFAFVVVSKKCIPFSTENDNFEVPNCFYENESLDYRVWQYNEVIKQLLIPIEFIRHKKDNLTFKIYPDYDHSFNKVPTNENEDWKSNWMDVFDEFIEWTNK
jgi:hypothetical protein